MSPTIVVSCPPLRSRLLPKPYGSGKEWELIDAFGEERGSGGLVYQFEYRVQVSPRGRRQGSFLVE